METAYFASWVACIFQVNGYGCPLRKATRNRPEMRVPGNSVADASGGAAAQTAS
jgi:hypothetical protein